MNARLLLVPVALCWCASAAAAGAPAAASSGALLAPQGSGAARAAEKERAAQRRRYVGGRAGRYEVRGAYDLSMGYGDAPVSIPMTGEHQAESLFEGQLLLERTMSKAGGAPEPSESWSLFGYRKDSKQLWSVSFDGRRTPFLYVAGTVVEGEARLRDPQQVVYSHTAPAERGGWRTVFGLAAAKRPILAMTMTLPEEDAGPVELVAASLRQPLVPERRNLTRGDKDAANNWHDEHEVLARFAGDYRNKRKKVRLRARVVCAGRFLLWFRERDGVLDEVAVTGYDGPAGQFVHWRVSADEGAPRPFVGAFEDGRLELEGFMERGELGFTLADSGRLTVRRRGTGGRGSLKLERERRVRSGGR